MGDKSFLKLILKRHWFDSGTCVRSGGVRVQTKRSGCDMRQDHHSLRSRTRSKSLFKTHPRSRLHLQVDRRSVSVLAPGKKKKKKAESWRTPASLIAFTSRVFGEVWHSEERTRQNPRRWKTDSPAPRMEFIRVQ